ncbi:MULTISPECIES: WecB/TagA/CpsF family glycosyltransferase [unclassified Pseudoalteromonas]|uniref:WecB/TagA/CpsF family glycosyltransferase n=1 Tax=unclassified Pseudoalteromonas TaxID=194690 RepID=UPI00110B0D69|nr:MULTISPECIES: WecB/TagA/CpsF family glycosyltransferase [unclassified Pseudoalteromonas]MCK8131490.1 WecB/TagA/CpsF family glycosyltransferase [Pseudoalteromonas sp. 2CM28B]TMP52350.1 glycosyltransferase [Pseudoalteromonas sp. S1612]
MIKHTVFGLKYHVFTPDESIDLIFEKVGTKAALVRADLNVGTVVSAQENIDIANYINDSDLVNIDGMGILFYLRLRGVKVERYTGVDIFIDVLKRCTQSHKKVFVFGAKPETLNKAEHRIKSEHGDVIAGVRHGYIDFTSEGACKKVVEDINRSGADFLFLGIKSPEKELFITNYRSEIEVSWIFGVGGAIDVVAGEVQRAPQWIQNIGFEWLYRVSQEPKRMWKRYLVTNSKFVYLLIKNKFSS